MASDRWDHMMNGSGGMTYGGFWLMLLVGILLVMLLGVAIYVALRAVNPPQPSTAVPKVEPPTPAPRDVLDLRLARGEITPDEYSAARPLLDR
jgi:putative membrane protein